MRSPPRADWREARHFGIPATPAPYHIDPYAHMINPDSGNRPVRLTWAIALAVSGCASAHSANHADAIPVAERAQALSEVVELRYWNIGDKPAVDPCSVYSILGRDSTRL